MPALLAFIPAMFSGLFAQFILLFGRKYTVGTASVLAYIATTAAMIFCLKQGLSTLSILLSPPLWLVGVLGWIIPSNFIAITSAIASARICRAAFDMAIAKIKLINGAS